MGGGGCEEGWVSEGVRSGGCLGRVVMVVGGGGWMRV